MCTICDTRGCQPADSYGCSETLNKWGAVQMADCKLQIANCFNSFGHRDGVISNAGSLLYALEVCDQSHVGFRHASSHLMACHISSRIICRDDGLDNDNDGGDRPRTRTRGLPDCFCGCG
jgi:hypothetical protein